MKRLILGLFVAVFGSTLSLHADDCCQPETPCAISSQECCEEICCPSLLSGVSAEFRVAGFFPTNSYVKRIYGNQWADYQLQIGKKFWCNWQVWAEASWYSKKGKSIGLGDSTTLSVVPLSLGLKYIYPVSPCFDIYLGVGASYSFFRTHDRSPYVHQHVKKNAFGGIGKAGVYYHICDGWFADLFVDYVYQKFTFKGVSTDPVVERHTANLSGFKVGLGIGYEF